MTASAQGNRGGTTHLLRRVLWEVRRRMLRGTFELWQLLGLHITANHYYEPIPDTRTLLPRVWDRKSAPPGLDMRDQDQVALLQTFASSFRHEYETFPRGRHHAKGRYYISNGSFESVDGEVLYCMIRHFKPRRLIEIGAGASTLLAAQALCLNASEGYPSYFTTIDPFPPREIIRGLEGLDEVICKRVQDVDPDIFMKLESDDILFIDSSHVVQIGGDVTHEILEILPRLQIGVIIHHHDIFLPAEYPRDWVIENKRFWSEQYLLQAFLSFNTAFKVLWGASYMHLTHPEKLEAAFPSYERARCRPGSFWIGRIR